MHPMPLVAMAIEFNAMGNVFGFLEVPLFARMRNTQSPHGKIFNLRDTRYVLRWGIARGRVEHQFFGV